jgi:hypothetical protein
MVGTTVAAIIAAAAAVLGGLLTAFATRSVERLRLRTSLVEKAEERRLASIEEFMLATTLWLDWIIYIHHTGWQDKQEELNRRVRARDEAYRRLLLLASDDLYRWLKETYLPMEYQVRETYVRQLRHGGAGFREGADNSPGCHRQGAGGAQGVRGPSARRPGSTGPSGDPPSARSSQVVRRAHRTTPRPTSVRIDREAR